MTKQCSKCKTEFTCTNEKSGCWCEEIKLTAETLKELRRDFQNCLCRGCLETYETLDKS